MLTRTSGPANNYCRSVESPVLVGTGAFRFAGQAFNSSHGFDVICADMSTYDKSFQHSLLRTEVDEQLRLFDQRGQPPRHLLANANLTGCSNCNSVE